MSTKIPKSPPQKAYSVNALATMLNSDRRTISKAVFGIQPASVSGKTKCYRLDDVRESLKAKPDKRLKEKLLEQQIRKLQLSNDKLSHALTQKSKIVNFFNGFISEHRAVLHQKLENDYPTKVVGMDAPQVRIFGKQLADSLDEIARRHGEKLEAIE